MTDPGDDWWDSLTAEILACLAQCGAMSPAEVGGRLGISEAAATSLLTMLAREGKVRVCRVELAA